MVAAGGDSSYLKLCGTKANQRANDELDLFRSMSHAEGSTMPRRTSWRAQVGWAWWTLCQLSPRDTMANGHKLVLRSGVGSERRPKVWQSEFTDQVT